MTGIIKLNQSEKVIAFVIAILFGIVVSFRSDLYIFTTLLLLIATFVLYDNNVWKYGILVPLFGLAIWSYGFNNIPFIRPLPLVDALAWFAILLSLPHWWKLTRFPIIRQCLFFMTILTIITIIRIIVDTPKYGLLAPRDALFVFELWLLFPAILLGYNYGEKKVEKLIGSLFLIATIWFLLYPLRDLLISISPIVGIQRPVPLFQFTTAGFLSVPAFFWFLNRKGLVGVVGTSSTLIIILLVQSRGVYIAFILSIILSFLVRGTLISRWKHLVISGFLLLLFVLTLGSTITGRLGLAVGFDTVKEQLATLFGKEGTGSGSLHYRLVAWSFVLEQVLEDPLAAIFGLGLGMDLFLGLMLGPDILVRKPHNDFLEIWARLGIVGLIPWLGILLLTFRESLKYAINDSKNIWVLALQTILLITALGQPATAFAYVTIVWVSLTGLWIGSQLKSRVT